MRPRTLKRELIRKSQKLADQIKVTPKFDSKYKELIKELTKISIMYNILEGYITVKKED